jgi:hypothetical protein
MLNNPIRFVISFGDEPPSLIQVIDFILFSLLPFVGVVGVVVVQALPHLVRLIPPTSQSLGFLVPVNFWVEQLLACQRVDRPVRWWFLPGLRLQLIL